VDSATREEFRRAINLYNRRQFLSSQERFEAAYSRTSEASRPLVRALLMLACAMHLHFARGGGRGVNNLLRQCLLALEEFHPNHCGVEVEELCGAVGAFLDELGERRKAGAGFFDRWLMPRVRYSAGKGRV